jgi:hypothetical protein
MKMEVEMCEVTIHEWQLHKSLFLCDLKLSPFSGLEPRVLTRWEMQKYARDAYDMGIRYIGGCCGFEAYHIRAVSEELSKERNKVAAGSEKHDPWGAGLLMHTKPWVRARYVHVLQQISP